MARWYTAEDWAFMRATGTPPPKHELSEPDTPRKGRRLSLDQWVLASLAGLLGVLMSLGWLASLNEPEQSPVATSPLARTRPTSPPALPAARVVTPVPISEPAASPGVLVTRVIDGDTFELEDGTRVRPLGINSCEMSTPAGPEAKDSAETWLLGERVVLTTEPGVDKDRYGRLLRYVSVGGSDFGKTMVVYTHTGIYQGRDNASATYLASLREVEYNGMDCSNPGFSTMHKGTAYVPVPNNDDDGGGRGRDWCRKWWC